MTAENYDTFLPSNFLKELLVEPFLEQNVIL